MWAVMGTKGGVGTSVVAVLAALAAARCGRDALLVDATGDVAGLVGASPTSLGVAEWAAARRGVSPDALRALETTVAPRVAWLGRGSGPLTGHGAEVASQVLAADPRAVVVDVGRGDGALAHSWQSADGLVVARPCAASLCALAAGVGSPAAAGVVVLVGEPGRRPRRGDVTMHGAARVVVVGHDRRIGRLADAARLATGTRLRAVRALAALWR